MSAKADDTDAIVVRGYSQRYDAAFRALIREEGGYVNDPADRGGETKYGISLRFLKAEGALDQDGDGLADFDLDMDGDIDGADIRRLALADVKAIYYRCFWLRLGAEQLVRPIGEMLFDQAVNGGLTAARKLLQRAINNCTMSTFKRAGPRALLTVDGDIGPRTAAVGTAVPSAGHARIDCGVPRGGKGPLPRDRGK